MSAVLGALGRERDWLPSLPDMDPGEVVPAIGRRPARLGLMSVPITRARARLFPPTTNRLAQHHVKE